jgi:hypothetical protein
VTDRTLSAAVKKGHLDCVKLLLTNRLSDEPFIYKTVGFNLENPASSRIGEPARELCCLQYIIDEGCPIHAWSLILAAGDGYVDCVHSRGFSLWEKAEDRDATNRTCSCISCEPVDCASERTITFPCKPEDASRMYTALLYGALMGAPLSPAMEDMFKTQRKSTCAVLLCFHVATGLSQGEGSEEQRAAWSCMGRIPLGVIEKILLLADLEIPESLRRGLPENPRTTV